LRRLSVFAGGWALEAAESICAGSGNCETPPSELRTAEVADLLTRLVDKSLVVFEHHSGQGRYRLLETIRQYGWERGADEARGRKQRCAAVIGTSSGNWRRRMQSRGHGCAGWSESTTTCGQRWPGAKWKRGALRSGCGWRVRSTGSGMCVVTGRRGLSGCWRC